MDPTSACCGSSIPFTVRVVDDGHELHLALSGELDLVGLQPLHDRLDQILDVLDTSRTDVQRVVVDLSRLVFVSVAGGRALVATCQLLARAGRHVEVVGIGGSVRRLLELTGLELPAAVSVAA